MRPFLSRARGVIAAFAMMAACFLHVTSGQARGVEAKNDFGGANIVQWRGQPTMVGFSLVGDRAWLEVRVRGWHRSSYVEISEPNQVLAILADKRLAHIWPALLGWAGSDLGKLRVLYVQRAKKLLAEGATTPEGGASAEWVKAQRVQLFVNYTSALARTGDMKNAYALTHERLDGLLKKGKYSDFEVAELIQQIAYTKYKYNKYDEAIDAVDSSKLNIKLNDDWQLNIDFVRASLLAEAGRFQEALSLAQIVSEKWLRYGRRRAMPGAERQLAAVRVCALSGLGRRDEAEQELTQIFNAPTPNVGEESYEIAPSFGIADHAAICSRDTKLIVTQLLWHFGGDFLIDDTLLTLQSDARRFGIAQDVVKAAQQDPTIKESVNGRFRALPPELLDALNAWRDFDAESTSLDRR